MDGTQISVKLSAILFGAMILASLSCTGHAADAPSGGGALAMRGKLVFLRCASCHNLGTSAVDRIGPNLKGVVGRKSGSLAGYGYSPAMAKADLVWDEATLDRWLQSPNALVPGTAMAFAGLPKPEDRQAVIFYLETAGQ